MRGRFLEFAFWLMASSAQVGCAMYPPFDQTFAEIRTPYFEVLCSFDEQDTRGLSRTLESFHAGMTRALGIAPSVAASQRMQALAFDGRSSGRPFGIRGDDAYSVPGVERPTAVLRTAPNWRDVAPAAIRHRIEH